MGGGLEGYLMYWIRMVKLDNYLPEILDNKIYVGSSVDSMICSNTLNVAEWFIGEEEPGASVIPGLGYLDFEIYPHFEESLYTRIEKMWKIGTLSLLKDGEAIIYNNGKLTFTGEKNTKKVN